jgi:hypothetical protein
MSNCRNKRGQFARCRVGGGARGRRAESAMAKNVRGVEALIKSRARAYPKSAYRDKDGRTLRRLARYLKQDIKHATKVKGQYVTGLKHARKMRDAYKVDIQQGKLDANDPYRGTAALEDEVRYYGLMVKYELGKVTSSKKSLANLNAVRRDRGLKIT